jgi:hypothetical protein
VSHIVTIEARLHDGIAVQAACRRLGLPEPVQGTADLFSGQATGLLVQLPGWQYPAVVDVLTGLVRYDNFGGAWGEQAELDRFIQAYTAEKVKAEARKRGQQVSEQLLENGSIRLQIVEGG